MPQDELVWMKPAAIALLLGGVVFCVWLWTLAEARKRKQLAEEIKRGAEKGIVDDQGRPLCSICGELAVGPAVRTGKSWLETLPFFSSMNRLWAMPERLTVVDDYSRGEGRWCATHRRAGRQRLEQALGAIRSDYVKFNAAQQQKVAMLEQGGLEQLLREDHEEIQRQIGLRGAMRATLESMRQIEHQGTYALPPTSTDADATPHPDKAD